jgi:hypothetical protein
MAALPEGKDALVGAGAAELQLRGEGSDEEELARGGQGRSEEDARFDAALGALEDVAWGGTLEVARRSFFDEHACKFDDADEHKHEHFLIFRQYVSPRKPRRDAERAWRTSWRRFTRAARAGRRH